MTSFVAELGIVFLLFFLGLEFSFERLLRSGRHVGLGGSVDLMVNAAVGLIVGVVAFGFSFAALILAAGIYVSSSAVIVKGLIDFRRLADNETDLVLAILIFEDIVVAGILGFAAAGGGGLSPTLVAVAKALGFVTVSLAAARFLPRLIDQAAPPAAQRVLPARRLRVGCRNGGDRDVARHLRGDRRADGRHRARRDLRPRGDRGAVPRRSATCSRRCSSSSSGSRSTSERSAASAGSSRSRSSCRSVGKLVSGFAAGLLGGFSRRQSVNVGAALVAHGEFTIILAQIASDNDAIGLADRSDLVAFAGLYVLVTATIGVVLMKESKATWPSAVPADYPDPTKEDRCRLICARPDSRESG